MTQIKAQIEDTTSDYDKEKLQERLAKLSGGVAVIKVGAATEVELKEKKHRIEDALSTTRAAVEEGLVAGGGTALLQAIPALDALKLEGDAQVGVDIVRKALEAPARQIADNAGAVRRGRRQRGPQAPRSATATTRSSGEYGDMFKKGIVDAGKVTRSALQNAASIAAMVLTTETLITDIPEKQAAGAGGGHGHGGETWTSSPDLAQRSPGRFAGPGLLRARALYRGADNAEAMRCRPSWRTSGSVTIAVAPPRYSPCCASHGCRPHRSRSPAFPARAGSRRPTTPPVPLR